MGNPFQPRYEAGSTPQTVKFLDTKKPQDYYLRVLSFTTFLDSWIPCVVADEEHGGFMSANRRFTMPFNENSADNFLQKLGRAEIAARKKVFPEGSNDVWKTTIRPKIRYRLIGFDLTPKSKNKPYEYIVFDYGTGINDELRKLIYGGRAKIGEQHLVQYGPLFGYDIVITREGTTLNDTRYDVSPLDPTNTPFKDLTLEIVNNPQKLADYVAKLDMSNYFTDEQLKTLNDNDPWDVLESSLKCETDEEIIMRLLSEPIDFAAQKENVQLYPGNVAQAISNRAEAEIMNMVKNQQLSIPATSKLGLLTGPQELNAAAFSGPSHASFESKEEVSTAEAQAWSETGSAASSDDDDTQF